MRILLANKFAHVTGGADRHCLALAELLRRRGHEVAFLSTDSTKNVETRGQFIRPPSTHLSRDEIGLLRQPGVAARALWNREAARAMRSLVDSFRPDVVHAHKLYTQLSVAPVVVAASAALPIVQTLHDYEFISASALDHSRGRLDRSETRARYRALNTATFPIRRFVHVPRVTEFVAVSRFVARTYQSAGVNAVVLPNFASIDPPEADPAEYGDRSGVVYVGRLRPEKGVADVIALAESVPEVQVTIVGSGLLEQHVRDAAERLPNLTARGFLDREQLAEVLRGALVVVLPSRWQEPAGLAALEAMELGTPVVAYAVGGAGEYVRDAGSVVAPDVGLLAAAVVRLCSDEAAWTAASRRALRAIATVHAPANYVERLEEVYDRAVARVRHARSP